MSMRRTRAPAAGRDEVIGVQRMRKPFPLGKPKGDAGKAGVLAHLLLVIHDPNPNPPPARPGSGARSRIRSQDIGDTRSSRGWVRVILIAEGTLFSIKAPPCSSRHSFP